MPDYVLAISKDLSKLSQRSDEIDMKNEYAKITDIVRDLKDTIRANKNLTSLSAPQLNHFDRVFCINFNGDLRTFINPVITKTEGFKFVREKSPSIPDKEFIVPRNDVIYAVYQKGDGIPESNKFEGLASEIFQHQLDMLDGVLISDFGLEILPEFDSATDEEKEELLKEYMKFLRSENEKLNQEIENDPDLKKISEGAKFFNAVARGEVELEKIKKEDSALKTEEVKAE
jgi:peptide deformylase